MEGANYRTTVDAVRVLTNLLDIILLKEQVGIASLEELKFVVGQKLNELIVKL